MKNSKLPGNDHTESKKATQPTIRTTIIIAMVIIPSVLFFIYLLLPGFVVKK